MSLRGALSNAASGLNANSVGAAVVSSNLANALNENYGKREMSIASDARQTLGGVRVVGIRRQSDPVLGQQLRLAGADLAKLEVENRFVSRLEKLVGSVDEPGALVDKLTAFEGALVTASGDPSSTVNLQNLARSAQDLATTFRSASAGIQEQRRIADGNIAAQIKTLNAGLAKIEKLNRSIVRIQHTGGDVSGLLDQRDTMIASISDIVPLRVVQRDSGAVSLFSTNGLSLVDYKAVEFSFDPAPDVLTHMTVSNGLLSGLQVDGRTISTGTGGLLDGGSLAAEFHLRDTSAVSSQAKLDAIARDFLERLGPGGPDPTLSVGDAGIFTDEDLPFSGANEPGVSGRMTLNPALAPNGQTIWRWRDGIGASSSGSAGNSDLLVAIQDTLNTALPPSSATLPPPSISLVGEVQSLSVEAANNRLASNSSVRFAAETLENLRQSKMADGVNSDEELQRMLELQNNYAANARVIRAVNDMIENLLSI